MVMGSIPENVDVAIIGGGVGGYIAAIRAAQLGKSVALIEKHKLGGHCLNYACIPSKTLIHISDIYDSIKESSKFGISVNGLAIDAKKMYEWRVFVSKKLEQGVAFLCKSNNIDVFSAEATFLSSNKLQLTDGIEIDFKKAIIATGSEPISLKGFEYSDKIIDYKKALLLDYIPKNMAIIGAGYVAVEIGIMYAKLGSNVSIIARSDILSRFDPEAVAYVKKRMESLNIKIYKKSNPLSFDANILKLDSNENILADILVVAVGLSPYTSGLGLSNTHIKLDDKGFIITDKTMLTSDENIYAIGDVAGEPMLAHKAMRQGVVAGEAASGILSSYENIVVPAVIFSDPEIAIAGRLDGDGIMTTKFPLSALGRAIALDSTNGFVKIAYTEDKIVKGVEIVSRDANAMISEAALAIEMGATLEDIADTIHPHPTFSESIMEAAESALGRGIHFFDSTKVKK